MKWNIYDVWTKSGNKYAMVMGEWLKPGTYAFGEVVFFKEMSDEEVKEYFDIDDGIYNMWYDDVLSEAME